MKPIQFFTGLIIALLFTHTVGAQDWAKTHYYKKANLELASAVADSPRVVFMGNSITESWVKLSPEYFSLNNFVGRGISGQTTSQMLVRFRHDVIALEPALVVILAGTNDIAGNTGPVSLETILGNIISMTELARANDIPVILASVLPATGFKWRPKLKPAQEIVALNEMIKLYAEAEGFIYLDYYSSMVDKEGGLKSTYTYDGVHPNKAGYEQMELLASRAVKEALKKH